MSALGKRIQNALNECSILILVGEVLIGFELRAVFEPGFGKLSLLSKRLDLAALLFQLVALALLATPAAFHWIVEKGRDSMRLHQLSSRLTEWALVPFALALGMNVFSSTEASVGRSAAPWLSSSTTIVALACWYGTGLVGADRNKRGRTRSETMKDESRAARATNIEDRVEHVLTETRMVLPGAQALLGFQFTVVLTEAFARLPISSKLLHAASFVLVALAGIVLMTPAAFHRIAERGEATERFHRFSSRCLVIAMATLALGMCGDVYVVFQEAVGSQTLAVVAAAFVLLLFFGLWFGFTSASRLRSKRSARSPASR
ncbi:MAG: hypothetical protein HYR85_26285 [Planctomycetes bacterium]|nr:hypothetical protein [Planctomycetota bacterium]MBI3845250.1 hypothetical protein [Planctomycetota bacterium]